LGGDAEFDLQIRQTNQPVFRISGDETKPAQLMSNGEVIAVEGLSDAESAILMQRMRGWLAADLHRRRDYLERKIRRAVDYAEQLDAEISQLKLLKASTDTEGSLESLISNIETLTADPRYMAITDDGNSPDPHGKFARAPFAGYTPGGEGAEANTYQRSLKGFVKPTQ
jgi:type II secretory pathway component PulJ